MRHNIKIQEIDKQLLFNKLPLSFYQRNTFQVAKELLGKILVTNINGKLTAGKIVEVEPYLGGWDKASHSYPNKLTPRTKIQFKEGGFAYIRNNIFVSKIDKNAISWEKAKASFNSISD